MKRIVSILAALALAVSVMTGVSASETANATSGGLMRMSDSEKEAFINENLDVRLRRLSTLVTLSANRLYDEIADEVEAALGDGLTAVEIKEALYHSAAYCGYTRAALALDAADAALEALGQDVSYSSRITSAEEDRYEDGLAVQRFLFGPQIGTITEDMSPNMQLQTGICRGSASAISITARAYRCIPENF